MSVCNFLSSISLPIPLLKSSLSNFNTLSKVEKQRNKIKQTEHLTRGTIYTVDSGQLGVACEAAVEVGPDRTGFKERSISGFYLGPAIGWYRTHLVWCTQTKAVIKTKSVEFLIDAQFPGVTPEAQLLAAAKDWAAAIERLGQRQDLTEAQRVSLGSLFKTNSETFNELRATFLPSTMTEGEKDADRQRV